MLCAILTIISIFIIFTSKCLDMGGGPNFGTTGFAPRTAGQDHGQAQIPQVCWGKIHLSSLGGQCSCFSGEKRDSFCLVVFICVDMAQKNNPAISCHNQMSFFPCVFLLKVFRIVSVSTGAFLNREMTCRTCSKDARSKFPTEQDLTKA